MALCGFLEVGVAFSNKRGETRYLNPRATENQLFLGVWRWASRASRLARQNLMIVLFLGLS